MIGPGDHCKAINREAYPITVTWGNVSFILQPGKESFIPAEHMINFFGDPRSVSDMKSVEMASGQHAWVPDRASEVRRLRIKWAKYNQHNGEMELSCPQVDFFTLDGEPIPTVASDPDGHSVIQTGITQTSMDDRDRLIQKMQSQLDLLLREKNLDQDLEPVTSEDMIPVDNTTHSAPERKLIRAKAANDE